jgi:acyl-coenzyme A synthetase/AMP-(fatty) acid ligase
MLSHVKRLALGLERTGIAKGEVIMVYTPNHIYVPVTYFAIVGAGYAFSAANPGYTLPGTYLKSRP